MHALFASVLALTPWTSLLTLLLLALRRLLRDRLSPRCFQLAFLVLALRLALPFDLSLPSAPVQLAALPAPAALPAGGGLVSGELFTPSASSGAGLLQSLPAFIWAGGAAVFLAVRLTAYGRFCLYLHRCRRPADGSAHALARELAGRPLRVYRVPGLASPLLSGLFSPAVYLPAEGLSPEELPYVLAHECCHARHRDVAGQFLLLTAQAVHWFNPLVHLLARAAREDMELSCDESVLAGRSLAYRKAYGTAVLSSLRRSSRPADLPLSAGFSGSRALQRRFSEMFSFTRKRRGSPLLAGLVLTVLAASLLVSCGSEPAPGHTVTAEAPPSDFAEALPEAGADSRPAGEADGWLWPVDSDGYKYMSRGLGEGHDGIDLCADRGTPVYASRGGTVKVLPPDTEQPLPEDAPELFSPAYGFYVLLEDGEGYSALYAHCDSVSVRPGDIVEAGQAIATVGSTGASTGNHLHFEVHHDGRVLDPLELLKPSAP